ncbi:aminoglycoside phosphotransferase family protein [Auraticoccus monumenti]|uniref:Streptomycin 6-kinase n=1 Tax=Auraticoccus monumenti TaxID=675864 RepID=A0A1G7AGV8_9ACTN|nr:aminoglycoside phosphotransferase family protein [Auraticoccus monumenti]SDE13933.1 streptomycin 6-kinase [Auraticoccus monumenti]
MSYSQERVQRAADHWGLVIGEPLTGGSRSAVFAARDAGGSDVVLKLPPARGGGRGAASAEAAVLMSWAGTGAAITLLDATDDALLLERARPGAGWPWRSQESAVGTMVDVAGELVSRLWSAPMPAHRLPTLVEVYPEHERVAREDAAMEQGERAEPGRGFLGLLRLPDARSAADHLCRTTREPRLLHGDFITKNVVSSAGSPVGWVVLDPLPVIGDPGAEVAAFAAYQPAELILPVAESLARLTGIDVGRSLRWTAVWTVHQAAQAWREDQEEVEALIASATVRDLLTCNGLAR